MDSNKQKNQKSQNRPATSKSNSQAESVRDSKSNPSSSK